MLTDGLQVATENLSHFFKVKVFVGRDLINVVCVSDLVLKELEPTKIGIPVCKEGYLGMRMFGFNI